MAAYPGRRWTMRELVTYKCGDGVQPAERARVKKGIARVLAELRKAGAIAVISYGRSGSHDHYVWKSGT